MITSYQDSFDISDILIEYYRNTYFIGLERYFLQIEAWLQSPHLPNLPLIVTSEGSGKKTLLVKWMQYHVEQLSKNKDVILMNFATVGGNSLNYVFTIYKIIIKLRELFNISQKVDLQSQKLRKFFSYWLDVCQRKIDSQIQEVDYQNIIILLQGVDQYLDPSTGLPANVSFWLPLLPKNVKLILTLNKTGSQAEQYFKEQGCTFMSISNDPRANLRIADDLSRRKGFLSEELRGPIIRHIMSRINAGTKITSLFVKILLSCFTPHPSPGIIQLNQIPIGIFDQKIKHFNPQKIGQLNSQDEAYQLALKYWSKHLFESQEKYKDMLILLTINLKGITPSELQETIGVSQIQIKLCLAVFKVFLIKYKNYLMIKNDSFKKAILKLYPIKLKEYHQLIANVLAKQPLSIRRLQEQTYHMFMAKNHFKLKQIVSNIQNFLLFFNPINKYDLCKYWQALEQKNFDPVFQYNKSLQIFQSRYRLQSEDMFKVIVQISRFLKQFSDFQSYFTPKFKHSKIRGSVKHMAELNLYKQLNSLQLLQDMCVQMQLNQSQAEVQTQIERFLKVMDKKGRDETQNQQSIQTPSKRKQTQRSITLNVDIPINKLRVQNNYKKRLEGILCREDAEQHLQNKVRELLHSDKDTKIDLTALAIQQFNLKNKENQNYYYKRWIWLQFPWVCLSLRTNYSLKISQCFKSPTEYMSVEEQSLFNKDVISVAFQAKHKKQKMLQQRAPNLQKKKIKKTSKSLVEPAAGQLKQSIISQVQGQSFIAGSQQLNAGNKFKMLQMRRESSSVSDAYIRDEVKKGFLPQIASKVYSKIDSQIQKQAKNKERLRQYYDQVRYKNQQMQKEYLRLQLQQEMNMKHVSTMRGSAAIKDKIKQLQSTYQNVRNQYAYAMLQKERLLTLILICKQNKIKNQQQVIVLNSEAQCLSKMISWEKQQIGRLKLKLITCNKDNQMKQEIQKQQQANDVLIEGGFQKITYAKKKFQTKIQNLSQIIKKKVGPQKIMQQRPVQRTDQDQTSKLNPLQVSATTAKISSLINLSSGDLFKSQEFMKLKQECQLRRRLQSSLIQMQFEYQQQLQKKKKIMVILDTVQKAFKEVRQEKLQDQQNQPDFDFLDPEKALQRKLLLERRIRDKQGQKNKLHGLKERISQTVSSIMARIKCKKGQLSQNIENMQKEILAQKSRLGDKFMERVLHSKHVNFQPDDA